MRTLAVEPKNTSDRAQISVENMKQYIRRDAPKKEFFIELKIRDGHGTCLVFLNREGVEQFISALLKATIAEEEYAITEQEERAFLTDLEKTVEKKS